MLSVRAVDELGSYPYSISSFTHTSFDDISDVEFASYKSWIDKKTFLPVKIEYKDAKGTIYRRYTALKVETISGIPTVMLSKMEDISGGTSTVNKYSKLQYNVGIEGSIFSKRYLRTPPTKLLTF